MAKKAKKKVAKKAEEAPVEEAPVVEEKPGKEVESEPALVEEATILVRGKGMGAKMMTQSEYDEWQKNQ
jgi:hypothetical protein